MSIKNSNPVCIITGGNSGLGYESAKRFLQSGYHVIIACRSRERGLAAVHSLINFTKGNHLIEYMDLDLESRDSIINFSENFKLRQLPITILINNAAVYNNTLKPNIEDRIDQTLFINYYGPFLLTQLLLPIMKNSAPSRIVNVNSTLYRKASQDHDQTILDPCSTLSIEPSHCYSISKLRSLLAASYLSSYVLTTNEVEVINLCPGFIPTTELVRDTTFFKKFLLQYLFPYLPFTSTLEKGVDRIFTASTCKLEKVESGTLPSTILYEKEEFHVIRFEESKVKELWDHSLKVVGLK